MARVSFISLLGALFDRLQVQAADELAKRLNELVPASAREKTKRTPILPKPSDSVDGSAIFAGFPRQCGFYDATLAALLKIEPDCGEAVIKVLLMWQPRHYLDHSAPSPKNGTVGAETGSWIRGSPLRRGFNFAAFTTLIDPLRHLDQGWTDFLAACIDVIIAEFLRHVLLRHHGDLSATLLEKLSDSFMYYTKPGSIKYSGPDPATYTRLKGEATTAWLAIYGSISSRLPVEDLALVRATTSDEVMRYRMISLEKISDLMVAVQFMERVAAAIGATKKTKLRNAYLLCLDRIASSIDAKHKGWLALSARITALYRRALKWAKNLTLQAVAGPLSAVLLLRSSSPPEELLFFIAKRTRALQGEQTVETSLRTLLALLRGNTRELEFPTENLQKSDYKRLPYARTPLSGFPNANVAVGMTLEAMFGRNCRTQFTASPALMDLAVEVLLQVAAHDTKLFLYQMHRQLEAQNVEHGELLLILRTLSRMADPATSFWKAAACLSHASKSDMTQLSKSLQTSLTAAVARVLLLVSINHSNNSAYSAQPVVCVPDLRLLPNDANGAPLTHAVVRAFQRCEARLARTDSVCNKTAEVMELLRDMSSAMCMPLSSVHVQIASLEDSLNKRSSIHARSVSSAGIVRLSTSILLSVASSSIF